MEAPEPSAIDLCPSEHELLALVRGELTPGRLESILAHTDLCANCALVVGEAGLAVTAETDDVLEQDQRSPTWHFRQRSVGCSSLPHSRANRSRRYG